MLVSGIKRSKGIFKKDNQEIVYDNWLIYYEEEVKSEVYGKSYSYEKCPYQVLVNFVQSRNTNYDSLIGKNLEFNYDKFGKIKEIEIIK